MKKYIHPKLLREAKFISDGGVVWLNIFRWWEVFGGFINASSLLALWFEEETPDWIQLAYEYYQTPRAAKDKNNDIRYPMKFREGIEKYIPKLQKITIDEIDDYIHEMMNPLPCASTRSIIIRLLRAKWLLEE